MQWINLDYRNYTYRQITPGRADFEPRVLRETRDHQRPQGSYQGGHESHSWDFVQGRHGLRHKKCAELNSGNLDHTLKSTREQADRHRVWAISSEYNKLVVSEFSFNFNGNLRNDKHRKLGPVFWVTLYMTPS